MGESDRPLGREAEPIRMSASSPKRWSGLRAPRSRKRSPGRRLRSLPDYAYTGRVAAVAASHRER
jgi:hypothetical protein